jgi:hypothetical protein
LATVISIEKRVSVGEVKIQTHTQTYTHTEGNMILLLGTPYYLITMLPVAHIQDYSES